MADNDEREFERRSRRSLAVRVLAVAAIAALPLGAYLGFRVAEASRSVSSLAVFDRVFRASDRSETFRGLTDFAGQGLTVTDSRYLESVGDVKLFGGLGVRREDDGSIVSIVCLAVESSATTGSVTCVPRADFLRKGMQAGSSQIDASAGATFTWGPVGPPAIGEN